METTMIENTSPIPETNVPVASVSETPEPATTEVQKEPEQPTAEPVETPQEEPTVELDGEQVPLSQVKKWKEDYANDSKWKDKNRRESESINREKDRVRRLELLEPLIEQRPEILQQLFSPQKERDFDAELRQHYKNRPAPNEMGQVDMNTYNEWEMQRDMLLSERTNALTQRRFQEQTQKDSAKTHNDQIEQTAFKKYVESGELSQSEFEDLAVYIGQNIAAPKGKFPTEAFDIAYKLKFEDRWLSKMKINEAKKATEPIFKAQKTAAEPGKKLPSAPPKTSQDKEDDEFVKRTKARNPNYIKL